MVIDSVVVFDTTGAGALACPLMESYGYACDVDPLPVGYNGTDRRRTLVKFDLSTIPRDAVILDADLSTVQDYMANSPHPGKDRTSGFFGFAGHNDPVAFRGIRIKKI